MNGTNGAGEKVHDTTQEFSQDLNELGRELRVRANDIRKEAVKQLNTAADSIRKEVRESTDSSDAHKAADEVAKGLEKAATYLNNRTVEQMGEDATRVVRRNPMRMLFIAFVVGWLLGMMMRGGDKR
jgi:ElaB/YqjD/DUF883 family membrane-anchored ribosome-binding protein